MTDDMIRMIKLGQQGFHCSQILLIMGLENQGKENPDLVRAMTGLAGGLGFTGEACGALTGGACLLGLYAGRGTADEVKDQRLDMMIADLVEWFSAQYGQTCGGIRCEDILGNDPLAPTTLCPGMILGVYNQVMAILVKYDFDISGGAS